MKKIIITLLLIFLLCLCNTEVWAGRTWANYADTVSEYADLSNGEWTDLLSIAIPKAEGPIQLNAVAEFYAYNLNNSTDKIRFDIRFVVNDMSSSPWFGPYLTGYMDYTGIVINTQPAAHLFEGNTDAVITVQARYVKVSGQLGKKWRYIKCRKCSLVAVEVEPYGE